MSYRRFRPSVCLVAASLCVFVLIAAARQAQDKPLEFHITFDQSVSVEPFTGRVFVLLIRSRFHPSFDWDWFMPDPLFARDVKDWRPDQTIVIGQDAMAYPTPLKEVPARGYYVLAIMDFNRGGQSFSTAEGNGWGAPAGPDAKFWMDLNPASSGPVTLRINRTAPPREFLETARVKLVDIESKLLSEFHGRPMRMRAGVVLPPSHANEPDRRFPVIYEIPGFGGSHRSLPVGRPDEKSVLNGEEVIHVVIDPECSLGHHACADSANNGPWGRAVVEELIPAIEQRHRGMGTPQGRFVTGVSSGGWSSLWLQVVYPDFFGGAWSLAPDPVDFREFQRVNIYEPGANVYTDEAGKPRPLSRPHGDESLDWKSFCAMEAIMGHGGQLGSFEAVFSPRGRDAKPIPLWDRKTGEIDPAVAKAWERYDIRLIIERDWQSLGPKLRGKLHVYVGAADTFFLEGGVARLKESLEELESDAKIEILPGKDHFSLPYAVAKRVREEMTQAVRRSNHRGPK